MVAKKPRSQAEIDKIIEQVNKLASDRDIIENYIPGLSIEEFKKITGQFASYVIELVELNDVKKVANLRQDRTRRFLKKLAKLGNDKWLADSRESSTKQELNQEEQQQAEEALAKIIEANNKLRNFIDNPPEPK